MATRVCEALVRRLRETERSLATADAEIAQRSDAAEAEVQTDETSIKAAVAGHSLDGAAEEEEAGDASATNGRANAAAASAGLQGAGFLRAAQQLPFVKYATELLMPMNMLRWLAAFLPNPLALTERLTGGGAAAAATAAPAAAAQGAAGAALSPRPRARRGRPRAHR